MQIFMFMCQHRTNQFQKSFQIILRWHQARCQKAALAARNRTGTWKLDEDQLLTWNDLHLDLTCNMNKENNTGAQLMPIESKQAGRKSDIYFLYNIVELLLLI